jgi:hypothetical protein
VEPPEEPPFPEVYTEEYCQGPVEAVEVLRENATRLYSSYLVVEESDVSMPPRMPDDGLGELPPREADEWRDRSTGFLYLEGAAGRTALYITRLIGTDGAMRAGVRTEYATLRQAGVHGRGQYIVNQKVITQILSQIYAATGGSAFEEDARVAAMARHLSAIFAEACAAARGLRWRRVPALSARCGAGI